MAVNGDTNKKADLPIFFLGSPQQKRKTVSAMISINMNKEESHQKNEKKDVFNRKLYSKGLNEPPLRVMVRCRSESIMYKSCENVPLTSDWENSCGKSSSSACIQSLQENSSFGKGSLQPVDKSLVAAGECIEERVKGGFRKKIVKDLNGSQKSATLKQSSVKQRRRSLSPASNAPKLPSPGQNSSLTAQKDYPEMNSSWLSRHSTSDLGKGLNSYTRKKTGKKRQRTSFQQGIVLDVAEIHGVSDKQNNSDDDDDANYHTSVNSLASTPSPKLVISGYGGSRSRPSPNFLVSYSPCPSQQSNSKSGYESGESSTYHSSCLYPPEECQRSRGLSETKKVVNSEKMRRLSLPAVSSQRRHSAQEIYSLQTSLQPVSPPRMPRSSATIEELHRTSLPYIPNMDAKPCREVRGSIDAQANGNKELAESNLLCSQGVSGVCGTAGIENKEVTDQTCRSNFGVVLSVLCFILFLWYLVMVYSRFINEALPFDAFETLRAPDQPPVQEIVVHISAEELRDMST